MSFIEELRWRGMLFNHTEGVEDMLSKGRQAGYIGFDPTAPSLTIGNYVQIRILQIFQKHGHSPIALMGGATGRIGDPSGKSKERDLLDLETLNNNLEHQSAQIRKYLNFDTSVPHAAKIVNNYDYYKDMNVLHFLREVGKNLTVNYMMAKDSVKNRLESGLSFTEFSYQLLQGYDFVCLYEQEGCKIQLGGSDQWGNITSGAELVRRMRQGKVHAITTPLLTKKDGTKFGKSTEGNIWLDPEMTSPYQFYQFWLNASDADMPTFVKYFSDKEKDEIEQWLSLLDENPNQLKREFAYEITSQIHSEKDAASCETVSQLLFSKRSSPEELASLEIQDFDILKSEIPSFGSETMSMNILELLAEQTDICKSKGDARRAIQNNAISVNKQKVTTLEHTIEDNDWLHGRYLLLENGKKNKYLILSTK